jgi:hypothetical protein
MTEQEKIISINQRLAQFAGMVTAFQKDGLALIDLLDALEVAFESVIYAHPEASKVEPRQKPNMMLEMEKMIERAEEYLEDNEESTSWANIYDHLCEVDADDRVARLINAYEIDRR